MAASAPPSKKSKLNFLESLPPDVLEPWAAKALGDMTPAQRAAFDNFKAQIDALPIDREELPRPDVFTLLRFFFADGGNKKGVPKSVARLTHTMRWWKTKGVDAMFGTPSKPPAELSAYERMRVRRWVGFDKEGRPVQVDRIGEFMGSGNHKAFDIDTWLRCYTYDLATIGLKFAEASKRSERNIQRYTFVGDCRGLRVWPTVKSIPLLKVLTKEIEVNFPEIAGPIVLVYAPRLVSRLYAVVRTFLDPAVAAKVQIYSNCPEKLVQSLGAECLPVEFGGTSSVVVPHTEAHTEVVGSGNGDTDGKAVKLHVSKHEEVAVPALAPGDSVMWRYRVVAYDLSVSVVVAPRDDAGGAGAGAGAGGVVVVTEPRRVSSEEGWITGEYQCAAGTGGGTTKTATRAKETVLFRFDNSFSYVRGKDVEYSFEILRAGDGGDDGSLSSSADAAAR